SRRRRVYDTTPLHVRPYTDRFGQSLPCVSNNRPTLQRSIHVRRKTTADNTPCPTCFRQSGASRTKPAVDIRVSFGSGAGWHSVANPGARSQDVAANANHPGVHLWGGRPAQFGGHP